MPWRNTTNKTFQPLIRTMTYTTEAAHSSLMAHGGTAHALMPIWTGCTSGGSTIATPTVWTGCSGQAITTHWKPQSWWSEENRRTRYLCIHLYCEIKYKLIWLFLKAAESVSFRIVCRFLSFIRSFTLLTFPRDPNSYHKTSLSMIFDC